MKVNILLWYSLSISVCQALDFGERIFSDIHSAPYPYFITAAINSPKEFAKQKEKSFCDPLLPKFSSMDAVTWLTFHLHVALHLSELYNLGFYQDINQGKVCVHGKEQLVRVSFPDSPLILHDQGTVTVSQKIGLDSNHRILHPFDDLANFARPDLPMTIPSWRFLEDRNIVNAIFRYTPLKFLSSFSSIAQRRLLIPLHPIYMVQDIYLALTKLSKTELPDTVLTRMRDQTLLSNQYLQSSIVWPFHMSEDNKYPNNLPPLPKTIFVYDRIRLYPLEFSLDQIPLKDIALSTSPVKDALSSPPNTINQSKLSKEAPSSVVDVSDSPLPTTEEPLDDKKVAVSVKSIIKSPLFHSTSSKVHHSTKKVTFVGKKKTVLLQKLKKTQSFLLDEKDVQKRVLAKRMIDVGYAKDYFSKHPFFSSFIHNKETGDQAFFSLRHFIKKLCQEYRTIDAPLFNVVCKRHIPSLERLKIFEDQHGQYRPFLLSWFSNFLSPLPHALDRHPDAPSLLKAQLLLLGKASFYHLQRFFLTQNNLSFVAIREGHKVGQPKQPHPEYLNSDQCADGIERNRWDEDDGATNRLVRHAPILRSLPPLSEDEEDDLNALIAGLGDLGRRREDREERGDDNKNSAEEAIDSNNYKGLIACGKIINAFLHYFAYISMPSAHNHPLPQKLSLLQGKKQFNYRNKKNNSIFRVPIMAEISRLYNSPFFLFIKGSPLSSPLSFSCLLFQLNSRHCQEHTQPFVASSSSSSTSLAFLNTASRMYEQSLSFSTEYLKIASLVPQESLETLSFFHYMSTSLSQFKDFSLLSKPAFFAYFLAAGALGPFRKIDHLSLHSDLCDSNSVIYNNSSISKAYSVYNFNVSEEIKPLCDESDSVEKFPSFLDDCLAFGLQISYAYNTLGYFRRDTLMKHIFLRWIFVVYEKIRQKRTDFVTHQHDLLLLATARGKRQFNEFLHDAALLQTISNKA